MLNIFKFNKLYGSVSTKDNDDNIPIYSINQNNIDIVTLNDTKANITKISRNPSMLSKASTDTILSDNNITIIANTMNALLGVSIFAMPWGFMHSGIIGGSFLVIIIGLLSFETARVLLIAQRVMYDRTGDIKSYPEIAQLTLGNSYYAILVQVATLVSCIGGCVGYLIFLGETVGQLFGIALSESIYYVTIPLILLSWVRSFRNLSVFTVISVVSIILAVFTIIYDGSIKMKGSISDVPMLLSLPSTLQFLGPATFLFTIHYCILSMGAETLHEKVDPLLEKTNYIHRDLVDLIEYGEVTVDIDHGDRTHAPKLGEESKYGTSNNSSLNDSLRMPTIPTLTKPLIIAYILSAMLIALLGGGGFIVYRNAEIVRDHDGNPEPGCAEKVCQNVILNLSPGLMRAIVGVALIISIMMSYIIILVPAREHIELAILKWLYPLSYHSKHDITMNIIRATIVIFTAIAALEAPYFGSVIGAVGGLTDALQSFVLPPLIFLKVEEGRLSFHQKIFYYVIFIWGLCTILYTTGNILQSFANLE